MKKILYFAAAVFAMAFAASCQQEKIDASAAKDCELVEVTFEIAATDLTTKAIIGHEPNFIKNLQVGIYRNGNYLPEVQAKVSEEFGRGLTAKVSVVLVKGQKYDIAFWADHVGNPYYTVDFNAGEAGAQYPLVTVDYAAGEANNIYRDAWCAVLEDYHVSDNSVLGQNETITLYRPLAQINVGTRDYKLAQKAGVTVTGSSMTVKQAPTKLNMFTGETSEPVDVVLERSAIPAGTLTVYYQDEAKEAEYDYLGMNYILVSNVPGAEKEIVEVVIDFFEDDNTARINDDIVVKNVPVRRNYRTNLIADDVLTQAFDFSVVIDPNFDGEYTGWDPSFDEVQYK